MKKLMTVSVILLALVLLAASCAAGVSQTDSSKDAPGIITRGESAQGGFDFEREEGAAPAPAVEPSVGTSGDSGFIADGEITERMIVRTGQMSLVVDDVQVSIDDITSLAEGFEGYVVSSRVWKSGERLMGNISIRVPSEHFDDATRALRQMAVDVQSENSDSRDVTEEYTDLSAKLTNLEATEQQLLAIMEQAKTVEEILKVQAQLSKTREDIERTKGRMQYLERTSATSLIDITLEQSKLSLEFTAQRTTLEEREKVRFYAEVSGGFYPYTFEWDFGDGETSRDEQPQHAYNKNGVYTVSLTITDDKGNSVTKTREEYIEVLSGWQAGNTFSNAWNGFVGFFQVVADIAIWLLVFAIIILPVGGLIWWTIRKRRRGKKAE